MRIEKTVDILNFLNPLISVGIENYLAKLDSQPENNPIDITKEYYDYLFNPLILMLLFEAKYDIKDDVTSNYGFNHSKENIFEVLNIELTDEIVSFMDSFEKDIQDSIKSVASNSNTVKIKDINKGLSPIISTILNSNFDITTKSYFIIKLFHTIIDINSLILNMSYNSTLEDTLLTEGTPSKFNN